MASYNVNSLPSYVDQSRSELIAKAVIGAKTAGLFTLMTGVKGDTALNLISSDVNFQDGTTCGWSDNGETTLSQRVLSPRAIKVNMSICDKNLLDKWANYLVRVEANKTDADLPFEKEFVDDVIKNVNAKIEKMIWQNASGTAPNFNGIINILKESNAVKVTQDVNADVYGALKAGIAALPAEVLDKDDLVAFISISQYNLFMQQLVEKNLYHYNPGNGENEFYFPGTTVKVIGVPGLNGANEAVIGSLSNFFYGTNLVDGTEIFDLWYSKDNREFRLAIEFTAGTQVAWPEEIVIVTLG